jgi:hypothetical protein
MVNGIERLPGIVSPDKKCRSDISIRHANRQEVDHFMLPFRSALRDYLRGQLQRAGSVGKVITTMIRPKYSAVKFG